MSESIHVDHVVKRYGELTIIPDLSLDIKNNEFFTLLGPSGCGKTTLLRMIAGFNSIEGGTIAFSDKVINSVPAHKRNIGMVFQDYAIFPHLSVEENIRYGLKQHKIARHIANERVERMLKLVKIEAYRKRLPEKLSGGQQQRVALARAIAIHPDVLLMDEPLSNLDAKLRIEMRSVIREIQQEIGITTVYVTHDQEEALAISDRIAVINLGEIQQVATPPDLYMRPYNTFVADFIGSTNMVKGTLQGSGATRSLQLSDGYTITLDNIKRDAGNGSVLVGIRPEELYEAAHGIKVTIRQATYLGRYVNFELEPDGVQPVDGKERLTFAQDMGTASRLHRVGDTLTLAVYAHKINVFDAESGTSLMEGVNAYAH